MDILPRGNRFSYLGAQFGDFVNGAQVVIDQFIVSAEHNGSDYRTSDVSFHGYEGKGS
ncbi:MAG: hypothetical protein CM15mP127_09800 [Gammaproteobacteria bacterium]|nr:MAG: hypothetical protein CM15mP127_09800 [Gammaproteobacteria bacterium]